MIRSRKRFDIRFRRYYEKTSRSAGCRRRRRRPHSTTAAKATAAKATAAKATAAKKTAAKKCVAVPFPSPDVAIDKHSKFCDLGQAWSDLLVYRFLEFKHGASHCILTPRMSDPEFFNRRTNIALKSTTPVWSEKNNTMTCPAFYRSMIKSCKVSTTRYVVFPLTIACDVSGGDMHQNLMIYDKICNALERFEPFGKHVTSTHEDDCLRATHRHLDDTVDTFFKSYFHHTTYIRPIQFPNFQGLQETEGNAMRRLKCEGFCATWSAWYADLIMSNADCFCRKKLIEVVYAFIRDGIALTRFINAYGHNIESFLTDYRFVTDNWSRYKDKRDIADVIRLEVDHLDVSLYDVTKTLYLSESDLKTRLNTRNLFLQDLATLKFSHWEYLNV
jgi:hypothetical protein